MLDIPMFWLGPLGRLMPMAVPEPGLDDTPQAQVASSTSVNARTTVTLQGFRRKWGITEAWLTPEDRSYLEAMYEGAIRPPLRIIDPLLKNRFRMAVAATRRTSIWSGGVDSWACPTNNGVITNLPNPDFPLVTYISEGDARQVAYRPDTAIHWNVADGGDMRLYPNGLPNTDGTYKRAMTDPIRPGETVTVSFFTRIVGTGTVSLGLGLVTSTGTVLTGPSTVFTNTTWAQVFVTYTAPTDGSVVGIFPVFTASAETLDLDVALGQLEEGDEPTIWEPGYGAPECYISDMSAISPRWPMMTVSIDITEL